MSVIIRLYSEHRMFESSMIFLSSDRDFRKGAEFFSTHRGFTVLYFLINRLGRGVPSKRRPPSFPLLPPPTDFSRARFRRRGIKNQQNMP